MKELSFVVLIAFELLSLNYKNVGRPSDKNWFNGGTQLLL